VTVRIVYVTQGYPPERVGGVETYLKRLVAELSAGGHNVFVFSRGLAAGHVHGSEYEEADGAATVTRVFVDLTRVVDFRENYLRPWLENLFRAYLQRVHPDVVHIQHLGGLSLGLIKVAHELGRPVVVTLSDHQPYCPRGQRIRDDKRVCKTINLEECLECLKPQCVGLPMRTAKLAAYLLRKNKGMETLRKMQEDVAEHFALVECFIMPSEFHRQRLIEAGVPAARSVVLPYGLDLSRLDQVPPRPAGAPVRRFAYLGTLIPSKGVEDVILAFKKMKTPGCSLHLYGEAVPYHGLADYGKRLVEMARSADISFYGPYQPEDIAKVMGSIDAVIVPSRWYESYGITIREAFRARRPAIVSDVGAFTEAVEHGRNGLVFPAGDVIALAETMDLLAADPEMAGKFVAAGGPMTSLPDHADRLLGIYRQVEIEP
jgi:glycosyltransferase involved in cell wall biosynthesis